MRYFNTEGKCRPDKHYMVDLRPQIEKALDMVDRGKYFCINRGRQYGKTTLINSLSPELEKEYAVFSISFEGLGDDCYRNERSFASAFIGLLYRKLAAGSVKNINDDVKQYIFDAYSKKANVDWEFLLDFIQKICRCNRIPIVVIIDEVDQASSFPVFINFLALLRKLYLENDDNSTFQSVILASVYDVKNLKLKVRPEEQHRYNSPWNIAVYFEYDMSLSEAGIKAMLMDYCAEHGVQMDTELMAGLLRAYTSGYPFLVSRLCQIIDEKGLSWNKNGFLQAVKLLLIDKNTLFDDMSKKLNDFSDLRNMLYNILYLGRRYAYNAYDKSMNLAVMFGYVKNGDGTVEVANRIFETWLYNLFSSEESHSEPIYTEGSIDKSQFINNGVLNMEKVLERFIVHFNDIYSDRDAKFVENMGRKLFLLYLRPIINGTGNYYIEAQTRDETRTDVVVDYLGIQYVVELKIWRGDAYNQRGEQQLRKYLDFFHVDRGYLLSFNFNKNKKSGIRIVDMDGKRIVEAVV